MFQIQITKRYSVPSGYFTLNYFLRLIINNAPIRNVKTKYSKCKNILELLGEC